MLYTEKVMEAFQNPKNVGDMEDYDGMGQTGSEACGDIMQVFIKELLMLNLKHMVVQRQLQVHQQRQNL